MSVQTVSLWYGTWVSEEVARSLVGGHKKQVLVGVNLHKLLTKLKFTFDLWDGDEIPTHPPQWEAFAVWLKGHLRRAHPAIFTLYVQGASDSDYDHIVPAVGVSSSVLASDEFMVNDVLYFNDNYDLGFHHNRSFGSLNDTRKMHGNCKHREYCVPNKRDYGAAVTGIVDLLNETVPVHISVSFPDEPNVSKGKKPRSMTAHVTVTGLEVGRHYALLRYDSFQRVPSQSFVQAGGYVNITKFVAVGATFTYEDPTPFRSDTIQTWRCAKQA